MDNYIKTATTNFIETVEHVMNTSDIDREAAEVLVFKTYFEPAVRLSVRYPAVS